MIEDLINHSNLKTIVEIEQQTVDFVSDFLQQVSCPDCPKVNYSFINQPDCQALQQNADYQHSIRVEQRDNKIQLSVWTSNLVGIPAGALRGWLESKVVLAMIESDKGFGQFNFQTQILPLMRVAGGALYFIRELVEHLSRALKTYEATGVIIKMNRGLPQVYYYFYVYNPTAEAKELYQKLLPHNWSRASHLCRKLDCYLALSYLAANDVGFSPTLLKDWQKNFGLTQKDQAFMKDMVFIANHYRDQEFSFRMVEMFKLLKESLLVVRSDAAANDSGLNW